jgi:hypothetical protein
MRARLISVKIVLVGTYWGRPLYGAGRAGSVGVSARARLLRSVWSARIGFDLCMGLRELGRRICENKIVKIVLVGTYRGQLL